MSGAWGSTRSWGLPPHAHRDSMSTGPWGARLLTFSLLLAVQGRRERDKAQQTGALDSW